MPALPLDHAGPYVAAAYITFLALILVYVFVMAIKLVRMERSLKELHAVVAQRARAHTRDAKESSDISASSNSSTVELAPTLAVASDHD